MGPELQFALILTVMISLFLWGKLSYELVAISTLLICYMLGFLEESEVFSGFASSSVIVFISTFFLAGALKKTGVTSLVADVVAKRIGSKLSVNILAVMLIAASLSAFISNVAAVALLLPTVISIAQINKISASRLLLPMAFGVIVGGTLTLIGTTGNIVATDLQRQAGLAPFTFFEFTTFGAVLLVLTVTYMIFWGYRFLPNRSNADQSSSAELAKTYRIYDEQFVLKVDAVCPIVGKTITEISLGKLLGVRVVAIENRNNRQVFPNPDYQIRAGDRLITFGSRKKIAEIFAYDFLQIEPLKDSDYQQLNLSLVEFADKAEYKQLIAEYPEVQLGSPVYLKQSDDEFLAIVPAQISKDEKFFSPLHKTNLPPKYAHLAIAQEDLFQIRVETYSGLLEQEVKQLNTAKYFSFKILAIKRDEEQIFVHEGLEVQDGDILICIGSKKLIQQMQIFTGLDLVEQEDELQLESRDIYLTEVVLSPRSDLIGHTLAEVSFYERYGFQVLAIWREGQPIIGDHAQVKLQFGDALLLQGPAQKVNLLKSSDDIILLYDKEKLSDPKKGVIATLCFLLMVVLSAFQILPVHIAAMLSAVIVIFSGALSIDDAYQEVSWKIVFLVAALIPIGQAFYTSGLATVLSTNIMLLFSGLNIFWLLLALALLATAFSQMLDVVISIILVGQIALAVASQMNIAHEPLLMCVTIAASLAFLTPFSHKANLLVMGPGGYRSVHYLKVGSFLTLLLLPVLVLLIMLIYQV